MAADLPPSPPPPPAPTERRRRPRWLTSIALLLGPPLLLVAALIAGGAWLMNTERGWQLAARAASALLPQLTIEGASGSLDTTLGARRVRWAEADWSVTLDDLDITPRALDFSQRRIDLERLTARRLTVDWVPSGKPAAPPASLGLPFELELAEARVQEAAFGARGAAPTIVRDIELAARGAPGGIEIRQFAASYDRTRIEARGTVGAARPFATAAQARLATSVGARPVAIDVVARGSLEDLDLALSSDSEGTRARGQARVHAFAERPLARLQLDVADFDPAQWIDGVPSMQLSAEADLAPVQRDGALALAGPFSVTNATAGPLDRGRVPVRALRGTLDWRDTALALAIDRAEAGGGRAGGTLRWATSDGVAAALRFDGIDLSQIDTRAARTQLAGQVDYALQADEQRFRGGARNARGLPLAAEVTGSVRRNVLEIGRAQLALGTGRADVRGRLELRGGQALRAEGSFRDLDLALLVPGWQTRLNGTFEADGRLQPRAGRARFALADSRIAGRPLSGAGTLALDADRLDADVELRSGRAFARAQGGLGRGRQLALAGEAPDLGALLPGYAGSVALDAVVSGEIATASAQGKLNASGLTLPGGQRIGVLTAAFSGGRSADAPFALRVDAAKHTHPSGPDASLEAATLIGRGTTGDMTLELTGATAAQQPLRVIAQGGLKETTWRGTLVAAEVGAPLDLLLTAPTPLAVGADVVAFGPADFTLRGARFAEVEVQRGDGRWRTAGRFSELQPQVLDARARAARRVVRTGAGDRVPLTLAGRWSLELTDRGVAGIAVVERTGGDLYSGVDGLAPIGVSDVGAALNVLDNRVTGNVYLRGRALGSVDAQVDAWLDPGLAGGRMLAQQRPFKVAIDATLPDLAWVGPLIGDAVQFGGRGRIQAEIGGTPAEPTSNGTLRGEALRLAWVDQGVRLENGTFDAVLEDGVLVIREAMFSGNPRVAPGNPRALEGLVADKPFEVRAVGRLALATLTGSIGVTATQLPVLQRADRWAVVSGTAGLTLTPQRAELYGKVGVDGAFFDFDTARGGRSLPPDVIVTRPGQKARAAAPPLEVRLDISANLGQHFYIEGAGLETRLTGAVAVSGRPALLRGEGSVQTVDGVFAGYGQRLTIQRGIVTFAGPIDNPALNVLAVRANLPVEVGVAITGTAQRPLVRLHSDPVMSETEKLNWLVLGRPPGPSDSNDRALLTAAASALFSGQTDRATAGLMRSLGIDQIGLQSGQSAGSLLPRETVAGRLRSSGMTTSTTAASEFLTVGKRINESLFLSFEQALTGAEYFVALSYQLTRSLSLIARAGSTNSIDLVYSIAFD